MFQASRRKLVLPFLLPGFLLIAVFFIYPAFRTVYVSFTDWNGTFETNNLVGFKNYTKLFSDDLFIGAIRHTFIFFLVSSIILFPLALMMALFMNRIEKGKKLFQFIVFAPIALSAVVAAILWKFIYNPNFGLLNSALKSIGLDSWALTWLGDSHTALISIVIASTWHGIGTWIILLMAGIDRIPHDLAEAASMDGADRRQVFWYITFPLLWDVIKTLIILSFVYTIQTFPFVKIMTDGGPFSSTEVMGSYLYKMAFGGNLFAYGSAMSIIMVICIVIFSYFGNKLMKSETIEY